MKQLDSGKNVSEIEVKFLLSIIKPLHSGWMVVFYNHMSTKKGQGDYKSMIAKIGLKLAS